MSSLFQEVFGKKKSDSNVTGWDKDGEEEHFSEVSGQSSTFLILQTLLIITMDKSD